MSVQVPGRRITVIGAGVSGLLAARRLRQAGAEVTVFEASSRIGGQVKTIELAGRAIDVGAEAMHLGAPGAKELLAELDLMSSTVTARPGSSWLLTGRGLRRLPAGVGPAGPTRLRPVLQSGIMSAAGLARAGLEPVFARRTNPLPDGVDLSVGDFVGSRFGAQVVERFVDPLLGSLHAGNVRRLSLRACAPSLLPAAKNQTPLLKLRPRRGGPAPAMSFITWETGLTSLIEALAVGSDIRTDTPVTSLRRTPGGYEITVDSPHGSQQHSCDGVVLAVSGPVAADLIGEALPGAAARLNEGDWASVATIILAYPRYVVETLPALRGTGLLVPSSHGSLLKAATFLSTKWPHLDDPETVFLRLSAGRAGSDACRRLSEEELLGQVREDLRSFIGLDVTPRQAHVERWPLTMPQLLVGHQDRIARTREDLARAMPGVQLAGSSYDGVGLAACITSGTKAAQALVATLSEQDPGSSAPEKDVR
ncbi:protoporphyrinogen oxidase [Gephyromycinifex aptenodytis]|uniref:protoporphyrinogen oxidase n=1 Tax=Gephyromycinifex aptenodytis TaxID=2716227 RepID=UPI001446B13F|nr:protoporphyrinogen oxidase [Gephyromycinifex aptenodytis]